MTETITTSQTIHTTREIEGLIPHRWPFLLVDRIVEYDAEAKRIVGIKGVTATEWFFQGHFTNDPCMPGTLMVEACMQAMAFYLTALGYTIARDGWLFEPTLEEEMRLVCRGQVVPESEELVYELRGGMTVVIVTHNMQQAARVSDRTAFMLSGELVEVAETSRLFTAPADERTEAYITGRFG